MAFDFNVDDPLAEEQPSPVAETPTDFEEQFSEAERRFARAQYYRALLSESIFEGDSSQNATEVVEEIRGFIRTRLAALLGVRPEPEQKPESQFSEEELQVLKAVCAKVLKKPTLIQNPAAPTLKKVEAPAKPRVKPARSPTVSQSQPRPTGPPIHPPAPKTPAPVATAETITVDNKVYTKMLSPSGEEFWQDRSGNRYVMATNDEGKHYFKSINTQARLPGAKPMPRMTYDMKMLIAARQAESGVNGLENRLERRQNANADNAFE